MKNFRKIHVCGIVHVIFSYELKFIIIVNLYRNFCFTEKFICIETSFSKDLEIKFICAIARRTLRALEHSFLRD